MARQVIVAIGREYGSGGHEIAEILAKNLGFQLYDRNILEDIANHINVPAEKLEKYDERKRKPFISRTVKGHSNSFEENLTAIQFKYLLKKAKSGESFVVVGRCAESILSDYNVISVFITGDKEEKLERIMRLYHLERFDAINKMKRHDFHRKQYHNEYSDCKWGDSRGYDLCINSSEIGVKNAADIIEKLVRCHIELQDKDTP